MNTAFFMTATTTKKKFKDFKSRTVLKTDKYVHIIVPNFRTVEQNRSCSEFLIYKTLNKL